MKMAIWTIGIVVLIIGITGFICLVFAKWILAIVCLSVFTVLVVVFGIGGLKRVHQEDRMVVEFFGKFHKIKKPGLRWICPAVMSVRAIVPIWEQTLVLFKKPIKIDFKDGSAIPQGVKAFVRIKDPGTLYKLEDETVERQGVFRAIYYVNNWRERVVELLENAVRSYLATLTIDEALPDRKGGYDLLIADRMPKEEKEKIERAMGMWGLKLERITVTDFDLAPEIVKARDEVQKRKRAVEAAEFEKKVRANQTIGALIQMLADARGKTFEEIQKEIDKNSGLKKKIMLFCQELITRQMSIDSKSLTDIRVDGTGDNILNSLLALIAAYKQIPGKGTGKPQGRGKPERKQSGKEQPREDED